MSSGYLQTDRDSVPLAGLPPQLATQVRKEGVETGDDDDDDDDDDNGEEAIPFLAPRSINVGRRPLFYQPAAPRRKKDSEAASASTAEEVQDEHKSSSTTHQSLRGSCKEDEAGGSSRGDECQEARGTPSFSRVVGDDVPVLRLTGDDKSILEEGLEALFHADPSTSTTQTHPFCAYLLQSYFHIPGGTFRPHQQEVCLSALQGTNTLAVCPTGWGKSLCYQFPMLVHRLLFEARYRSWETEVKTKMATKTVEDDSHTQIGVVPALPLAQHSKFCVVVSPLLSLMADQSDSIQTAGAIHSIVLSSQTGRDREGVLLKQLASPVSPIDVVFVSPEKLIGSQALRQLLSEQRHRLALICVDEVHCVSRWSYDFRPTFMYVHRVLEDLPVPTPSLASIAAAVREGGPSSRQALAAAASSPSVPWLCLTATATRSVVDDLRQTFAIRRTVVCTDQLRHNLQLQVVDLVAREAALRGLDPSLPGISASTTTSSSAASSSRRAVVPSTRVVHDALVEAVVTLPKPLLVYVRARADADELASLLATKVGAVSTPNAAKLNGDKHGGAPTNGVFANTGSASVARLVSFPDPVHSGEDGTVSRSETVTARPRRLVVRCYHAALSQHVRRMTQSDFVQGRIDVLVATVAFGMGIDMSGIRSVVHAHVPSSLEGYVQEIGRAGRDGNTSYCRLLYNPYDYYELRSRLWTSLISQTEMREIVGAILSAPVTRNGEPQALVSVHQLAVKHGLSEETIETVLFMMLSGDTDVRVFRGVCGTCPVGLRVTYVQDDVEAQDGGAGRDGAGGRSGTSTASSSAGPAAKRRRLAVGHSGVSDILAQLNATDAVRELLTVVRDIPNVVEAANRIDYSLADFQFRLDDLVRSGAVRVSRTSTAYVLTVAEDYAEHSTPAGQTRLAERLWSRYNERLTAQVRSLHTMFAVLAHPSHELIQATMQEESMDAVLASPPWQPPPRALTRLEAVSIANDFVTKNRLRLTSTYEAARALLGVMPKSLVTRGKYAGQLPLAQSWYVSSPYFGLLREFDVEWVLQVLRPHCLDDPVEQ